MNVIETAGLTKRYGHVLATDALSFSVEQGQVFGFLGPNGSGKTTTIRMLLGIVTPTRERFGSSDSRGDRAFIRPASVSVPRSRPRTSIRT